MRRVLVVTITLLVMTAIFYSDRMSSEMDIMMFVNRPVLGYLDGINREVVHIDRLEVRSEQEFQVLFDGKTVMSGGFLNCYEKQPKIASNGDSFYKISTKLLKQCRQQRITNVTEQNGMVVVDGLYDDCPEEAFSLKMSIWKGNLEVNIACSNKSAAIWLHSEASEEYFGLGEQFSYLSLGNRPYSMMVREKGVGRGDQPISVLSQLAYGKAGTYYSSYSPAPIWIGSRHLAYLAHTSSYLIWLRNQLVSWDSSLKLSIINKPSYKQLVKQICNVNGYTDPIPQWVNKGAIVGLQGGTTKVRTTVKKLTEAGANISGVWLQDWVGKRMSLGYSRLWWNWELDEKLYPDWQAMRQQFDSLNISLLIYMNPMLTDVANKSYFRENYYSIAKSNGYLVKDANNQVFLTSAFSDFTAGLIDMYNPEARTFYKDLIKKVLNETGAKGMMVDFGEAYPFEGDLSTSTILHNRYPVEWVKLVSQTLSQQSLSNQFFTFSRSSYLNSPGYTRSLWAGDQNMNYGFHNGLPSCLTAMLTSGLVGFSNTHCDVGGYVYVSVAGVDLITRDRELMERWMGLAAFSPVFRTHQGNKPEKTLQVWDMEMEFAYYTTIYGMLAEYRRQQAEKSKQQGIPLVRAMFLQLQNTHLSNIQDQYYLGDHILVAPLLSETPSRSLYLPSGRWLDLFTGDSQNGCDCFIHKSSKHSSPIAYISAQYHGAVELVRAISDLPKQTTENSDQL